MEANILVRLLLNCTGLFFLFSFSAHAYQIVVTKDLQFGTVIEGINQLVVVQPRDAKACVINITGGTPRGRGRVSVVERQIFLHNQSDPSSAPVKVKKFRLGGSARKNGKVRFNRHGVISNIRIGARTRIRVNHQSGEYRGAATFRYIPF